MYLIIIFLYFLKSVLVGYDCYFNNRLKLPFGTANYTSLSSRRGYYSTISHPQPSSYDLPPQPILTLDLNDRACIKSHESILKGKGGIYSLVNTVNGKTFL